MREKSVAPLLSAFREQVRGIKSNNPQAKGKGKGKTKKDKKGRKEYQQKDLKDVTQYALCDAMRYDCPGAVPTRIVHG